MEKRRFGRTEHMSSVAIFGGFTMFSLSQAESDKVMAEVIEAGVNHIDVAPSYGEAELRLGPWLADKQNRAKVFLGCKTTERSRAKAEAELHRSLERLQVPSFDLYQLHAVNTMAELDEAMAPGGALEAAVAARSQGLTRYIGITGHDLFAPKIFLEALRRFDFDTVLFPINFVLYANPDYRNAANELLAECRKRDVGVMSIKSVSKGPWHEREHKYSTWYEPFDDLEHIQQGVNFALSHDVTGLCSPGDARILPLFLQACANFTPLDAVTQDALIGLASLYEPIFTGNV